MTTSNDSLEGSLNCAVEKAGRACSERYAQCEESIRQAPVASVLFAALAGYILNFLPICGLISTLTRLFLALLKPAIFLFGAIKLITYIRGQAEMAMPSSSDDAERDPVIDSPVGPNS